MLIVNELHDDSGHEEQGHPERPDRTRAAMDGVAALNLDSDLEFVTSRVATRAELTRVHEGAYLDELGMFCYEGGGELDQDTYATFDSWRIAQYAAGGGLAVIERLRELDDGVGFVITRPPGHHALRDRAMGFCLLNNIAVAAASLTAQGERVLIVDWDVHHGNGTQTIFWNDPNVLYVSTHEWPLFPGSGTPHEIGGVNALGRTVNIPLPSGATGDVVLRSIEQVAAPVIDEFAPTWVLVSAGFDGHRDDPLASLALSSGDFAALAKKVGAFAPRSGRLALFLEGGYDLRALSTSVTATLSALLDGEHVADPTTKGGPGGEHVDRAHERRRSALRLAHEVAAHEEREA